MSTAFDVLGNELDSFIKVNSDWKEYIEAFRTTSSSKTLDELLNYNCGHSIDLSNFRYLLAFLQYHNEAPKGEGYSYLSTRFISLFQSMKQEVQSSVIPFIALLYLGALAKEIQDLDKLSKFNPWIKVYQELNEFKNQPGNQLDISSFAEHLALQITFRSWDLIGEPIEEEKLEDLTSSIDTLFMAQSLGLDINSTITSLFNHVHSSLAEKYKIYFPKEDEQQIPNFKFPATIVKKLKTLKYDDETIQTQLEHLQSFFVYSENEDQEMIFVRPSDLPYAQIDFPSLTFQKNIFVNVSNPKVSVNIYHYKDQKSHDIALKEYSASSSVNDILKVKDEIDILETLSKYSSPQNAFLTFYGSCWYDLKVYLSMEYHPRTLMQVISEMKQNKQKFSDDHIVFYTSQLCDAFSVMEQLGIYHQDIKPHNILMTNDGFLKIIDFSISFIKTQADATVAATGTFLIQGTSGYMAPELEDNIRNPERKARFRRNKADVFSLGMTLLQLYTFEELHTLNLAENHNRLMDKVNAIKVDWFRTLLSKMLKKNYNDRPSFKETLQYIPGGKSTTIA
jgi:hypothetical protein